MHTVVRYNRKGEKLFPVYWLVAQGHYKNKRGKYLEHLGYWIPKQNKKKKMDRSLILNKNRIRYWLAEGARIPYKAKRHMSFFGLSNEPWIRWGRKTISQSGEKEYDIRRETYGEFDKFHLDKVDAQKLKEANLENMLLRRVKLKQRLIEEFENMGQEEIVDNIIFEETNLEDNDDIMLRSSKYWLLYEEYEKIERNPTLVHPMRKELLFKKLNEFAEKGFIGRERIGHDNPYYSIFNKEGDNIRIQPHADHLKREIEEDKACNFFCFF
jgi:ribosomal protein S16